MATRCGSTSAQAGTGDDTRIAPDGSVWTLAEGSLSRVTTTARQVVASGLTGASFTLAGNAALVLDAGRAAVRFDDGDWMELPAGVATSEIVLQQPGPSAECGWVGADDQLWCVGEGGAVESATIDGLDIDGGDLLAIAGDAGAVVRRSVSRIDRIDWRSERILDAETDEIASPPVGADLQVAASVDLLWIDEVDGPSVWAVHPWGINVIDKTRHSFAAARRCGRGARRGRERSDAGGGSHRRGDHLPEPRAGQRRHRRRPGCRSTTR